MDCDHWQVSRGTDGVWRCDECAQEFIPIEDQQSDDVIQAVLAKLGLSPRTAK